MLSLAKRLLCHLRRYSISPGAIWLRQDDAWVELRLEEIAALKFESVSRIIVRYYDGRRIVVSLYGFPMPAYDVVCRSLRDALTKNEKKRGLWSGAGGLDS